MENRVLTIAFSARFQRRMIPHGRHSKGFSGRSADFDSSEARWPNRLAVVFAQSVWRLISALTWYLLMPAIGKVFNGNTESVLFKTYRDNPIPWENVGGSLSEFAFTVIAVFYLNRWIHQRPRPAVPSEFSLVGGAVAPNPEVTVAHEPIKS
jgi:hypothetical protein